MEKKIKEIFEQEYKISYFWSCDSESSIPKRHEEALEEDALERIFSQLKEGYREGQLFTSVRFGRDVVPEEDEEEGLTYSGWWSYKSSTK